MRAPSSSLRAEIKLLPVFLGFCLIVAGGVAVARVAEQVPEPTKKTSVYRVASSLVLVDAIVVDKHDRPVLNLSPHDFTIFEDDVPQTLESFRIVSPQSSTPPNTPNNFQNGTVEDSEIKAGLPAGKFVEERQYMVLLLDYASTELENQIYIRAAAKRYFEEHMVPSMDVAVVRVGLGIKLLQDFTDKPEMIVAALDHQDPAGSSYAAERRDLQRKIEGARQEENSLQNDITAIASGSNSADPRAGSRTSQLSSLLGEAVRQEKLAFAYQSFANQQQSRPILEAIRAIADSVKSLPGRKSLVLISRGFSIPEPLENLLYDTTNAANRAHLAIYALDSGGLQYKQVSLEGELHRDLGPLQLGSRIGDEFGETEFDRARQVGSDQQDSTLRYLSAATGGLLIRNTNDFESALRRIDLDAHSYYLLTYRPRNLAFDGGFRHIRVVVNRPGMSVQSRSGYYAMPPGTSALSPSEFRQLMTLARSSEVQDFPLLLQPAEFLDEDGTYTVELPVEIPQSVAALDGRLQIFGLVRASSGETIASFRFPSRKRPTQAEGQATLDGSVLFTTDLRLGPGTYAVDLEAVDLLDGRRSYRHSSLNLSPVEDSLAVSSLTLSRHVEPAQSGAASPWKVGQVRILPTSNRSFRSPQNLIYYFDIYYPKLDPATGHPDVMVTFSLERDGRTVDAVLPAYQVSNLESSPLPHVQVARYLTLVGLSPGDYLLRAHIQDHVCGRSVSTQASFELLP